MSSLNCPTKKTPVTDGFTDKFYQILKKKSIVPKLHNLFQTLEKGKIPPFSLRGQYNFNTKTLEASWHYLVMLTMHNLQASNSALGHVLNSCTRPSGGHGQSVHTSTNRSHQDVCH